jgi:hypothetical protein
MLVIVQHAADRIGNPRRFVRARVLAGDEPEANGETNIAQIATDANPWVQSKTWIVVALGGFFPMGVYTTNAMIIIAGGEYLLQDRIVTPDWLSR